MAKKKKSTKKPSTKKKAASTKKGATSRLTGESDTVGQVGGKRRKRREHGNSLEGTSKDYAKNNHCFNTPAGCSGVSIVAASAWTHPSIFRILPALCPDADAEGRREADYYRSSQAPNAFTDILRSYPAAYYVGEGDDKLTFFLYDALWEEHGLYDPAENPYNILLTNMQKAVKSNARPQWHYLIDPKEDQTLIEAPVDLYVAQVLVYKLGDKRFVGKDSKTRKRLTPRGLGENDRPQIALWKKSAGKAPKNLMNMVNTKWDGDPTDYENSMVHGDPVSLDSGKFLTLYNAENGRGGTIDLDGDGDDDADAGEIQRGYAAAFDDCLVLGSTRHETYTPAITGKNRKLVLDRLLWMEDLINLPNLFELEGAAVQEAVDELHLRQARWLAKCLRGYKKILDYVWRDKPEWLEDPQIARILEAAKPAALRGESAGGYDDDLGEEDEFDNSDDLGELDADDELTTEADDEYEDTDEDVVDTDDDGAEELVDEDEDEDEVEVDEDDEYEDAEDDEYDSDDDEYDSEDDDDDMDAEVEDLPVTGDVTPEEEDAALAAAEAAAGRSGPRDKKPAKKRRPAA